MTDKCHQKLSAAMKNIRPKFPLQMGLIGEDKNVVTRFSILEHAFILKIFCLLSL